MPEQHQSDNPPLNEGSDMPETVSREEAKAVFASGDVKALMGGCQETAQRLRDAARKKLDENEASDRRKLAETAAGKDPVKALAALDALFPETIQGVTFERRDPDARKWLVPGVLPAARLAGFYGTGGAGKSLMALQLIHALMHGGPVLKPDPSLLRNGGNQVEAGLRGLGEHLDKGRRILWVSYEDEPDEFLRRWRMAHHAGALNTDFPDSKLLTFFDARAAKYGPLWAPKEKSHIASRANWTDSGQAVMACLKDHALCVLDPLAAVYSGSENDRSLVREFTSAIDAAGEEAGCAVMLIGHTPKPVGNTRHDYSGSTDWQASVRAMLTLERSDTDKNGDSGDEARGWRLRVGKNSYGPGDGAFWLRRHWKAAQKDEPAQLAWFATADSQGNAKDLV